MNLLEFNDQLLLTKGKQPVQVPTVQQEECDLFRGLIAASKTATDMYNGCDDANSFFSVYTDIKKMIGASICNEVFYACKLTYVYDGVPSRLVYIISKMISKCNTAYPNVAINRTYKLLSKYLSDVYIVGGQEFTVKDVIENMFGFGIKLITSSVPKVKSTNCYEVYVRDVERVALIPGDIARILPYAECEKLRFDRQVGIVMTDGTPLRCLNGRLGITKDDFDLTDCL